MTYYNRGLVYYEKRDRDRAIADYNEAIRLNQKLTKTYNNRGVAHHDKGDLDSAMADCNQAITFNPKLGEAYANRGLAYRTKGDFDRAIADFNRRSGSIRKVPMPTATAASPMNISARNSER